MTKLVGYLRVSTTDQAENGQGLDIQAREIRRWAKALGHRIVRLHSDAGVSGSNGLDTRVALADALDDVRCGAAEGVVVYRLDRLARDLVVQETLLAEIRRLGGEVHSTSAGEAGYLTDDPDDPSRTLIRQVLGAVAQYERSMIAMRLRSGRRRKAENGGFAYGSPPFGFRAEEGALVPDGMQQAVLRRIEQLVAEGLSVRSIAQTLNNEGHPTKRPGARWHPTSVARLIRRGENV